MLERDALDCAAGAVSVALEDVENALTRAADQALLRERERRAEQKVLDALQRGVDDAVNATFAALAGAENAVKTATAAATVRLRALEEAGRWAGVREMQEQAACAQAIGVLEAAVGRTETVLRGAEADAGRVLEVLGRRASDADFQAALLEEGLSEAGYAAARADRALAAARAGAASALEAARRDASAARRRCVFVQLYIILATQGFEYRTFE